MELVTDAMTNLLFDTFKNDSSVMIDDQLFERYESAIQSIAQLLEKKEFNDLAIEWEQAKVLQEEIMDLFNQ